MKGITTKLTSEEIELINKASSLDQRTRHSFMRKTIIERARRIVKKEKYSESDTKEAQTP